MQIVAGYRDIQRKPKVSADTLASRAQYIIMKAQLAGNMVFDGHTQSEEEKKNAEECRQLCGKVESLLQSCKANEIPVLLSCYEILYIVGYRRMPDNNLVDPYKQRVIDVWKQGDKTIEESDVFRLIAYKGAYSTGNSNSEYVCLYHSIKEKWLDSLSIADYFPDVTPKENYERLSLIMRENLDSCFGANSSKIKHKWYNANKVSDLSAFSSTILCSYRRFITALYPDVLTNNEQLSLEIHILKELSSRHDVDPYAREGYRLALIYNNQAYEFTDKRFFKDH